MTDKIKAGRAVPRAPTSVDTADVPFANPSLNFASLAKELVTSHHETITGIASAREELVSKEITLNSTLLSRLAFIAPKVQGMTGAQWDKELKASIVAEYTALDYKAVPTRAAMLKVAVLALANDVKPNGETNLQKFVNEIARPALIASGVLEGSKKGRKEGSAKTPELPNDLVVGANMLVGGKDVPKDVRAHRVGMLIRLATPANWKLFEKLLKDGCALLDANNVE